MVAYVSSSGHCSSIAALNPHLVVALSIGRLEKKGDSAASR